MYVYEVGLELWLAVVRNFSTMTPELLEMFQRWVYYMNKFGSGSEHFIHCINILKSYLLLGKMQFVQTYAQPIQQILCNVIRSTDSQGMTSLANTLCLFIQL